MQRRRHKSFWRVLQFLFGLAFLVLAAQAGLLLLEQNHQKEQQEELQAVHEAESQKAEEVSQETKEGLKEINGEYLGWLKVYGTQADLPVVQGADNDYYLNHDFYGEENRYGCLFADCDTDTEEGNLLIYGHHMKDGSMFGELKKFRKKDFFEEYGLVSWEGNGEPEYYEIFAVLVVPGYEEDEEYFPIREYLPPLGEEETFSFLVSIKERASLWKDVTFSDREKFLFLMTCDYTRDDGRLLLCARKIQ